jgi:phosphonatase-like hydrolase
MKPELVIFDLAGTTVKDNQDVHRVLQSALAKQDIAITLEDANTVMGIPKPVAIRILLERKLPSATTITEDWISQIHEQFVMEMIRFYEEDVSVGEKEGVSETFKELKRMGIKVAVDTGFDRPITTSLLNRLGWIRNGLIDASVTSDEVNRGRPYADLILEAMKRTGVKEAAHVVKVGDTASDIQEGIAARCGMVVGITSGAFTAEALRKENPTHLIETIPQILPLINSR